MVNKISPITYSIQKSRDSRIFNVHVDHLKSYLGNQAPESWLEMTEESEDFNSDIQTETEFDVSEIPYVQNSELEDRQYLNRSDLPGPSNVCSSTPKRHVTRTGRVVKPRERYSPS